MKTSKKYAVLTGDIIESSQLSPKTLKKLFQELRDNSKKFNEIYPNAIKGNLDVYSGDSWQLLMTDIKKSIRAALYLRAVIKSWEKPKIDTRIAIAIGNIDEATLNTKRVSESTGEAFTESGRALQEMPRSSRMALKATNFYSKESNKILKASIYLLDEIAANWKPGQANTIRLALLGFNQEKIAKQLGVSQPTVNQASKTASWWAIESFLKELEGL